MVENMLPRNNHADLSLNCRYLCTENTRMKKYNTHHDVTLQRRNIASYRVEHIATQAVALRDTRAIGLPPEIQDIPEELDCTKHTTRQSTERRVAFPTPRDRMSTIILPTSVSHAPGCRLCATIAKLSIPPTTTTTTSISSLFLLILLKDRNRNWNRGTSLAPALWLLAECSYPHFKGISLTRPHTLQVRIQNRINTLPTFLGFNHNIWIYASDPEHYVCPMAGGTS